MQVILVVFEQVPGNDVIVEMRGRGSDSDRGEPVLVLQTSTLPHFLPLRRINHGGICRR